MLTTSVVILSAALLLAMILNLTLKPRFFSRLMSVCMIAAVVGGLLYYGVGFAETTGSLPLSLIRTPFTVIRMFLGVNEFAAISGSSLVATAAGRVGFWALHLLAFYSMTSAVLNTLGAEAMRALRLLLSLRGDLTLIYGINDESRALGRECLERRTGAVVFVAENASGALVSELNNQGMSVIHGEKAVAADEKTLRALRLDRRRLTVYALDKAEGKNLAYALRLKAALERIGARPENTRLALAGEEEIISSLLQVSVNAYGFGYVNIYEPGQLAARALLRVCPPWDCVSFGADGRAREDFHCAVVGFGRFGQAVLRELVRNGQFVGGAFRAAVFSPHFEAESGYLQADCPELLSRYHIRGFAEDGRSTAFYSYVGAALDTLKMIVVCTGDDNMDREISDNLMLFLNRRSAEQICVVRVGWSGVRYQARIGGTVHSQPLLSLASLSAEQADREAILLNSAYDPSPRSDWEKWVACDSFSKMSSRASADFMPALVKASGSSAAELVSGAWQPSPELLRVLGETEHLRWCAFHFTMGFRPMSRERFEERAADYARRKAAGLPCSTKIARDLDSRTHACLVPWDELDALSARERAVTGREIDYQQTDINNVLAMPRLLQAWRKESEGA